MLNLVLCNKKQGGDPFHQKKNASFHAPTYEDAQIDVVQDLDVTDDDDDLIT
jgi:hypothetical protein